MEKLQEGEKYLYVKLFNTIGMYVFQNKNKKNEREPDFKGDGVAVWVRKKRGNITEEKI